MIYLLFMLKANHCLSCRISVERMCIPPLWSAEYTTILSPVQKTG